MKGIEYTRSGEARRRLLNTLIRVDGQVAFVTDVRSRGGARDELVHGNYYGRRLYLREGTRLEDLTEEQRSHLIRSYSATLLRDSWPAVLDDTRRYAIRNQRDGERMGAVEDDTPGRLFDLSLEKILEDGHVEILDLPMSDDRIDLEPIKLGYAKIGNVWMFLRRIPGQGYSQGLHPNSVKAQAYRDVDSRRVSSAMLRSQGFVRMSLGRYPSFQEALNSVSSGEEVCCAFDINTAVVMSELGRVSIVYKNKMVADSNDASKGFRLGPKFEFMREELEQKGVQINDAA